MRRNTIVEAYLRHYLDHDPADQWASRDLDALVRSDPIEAWEITRLLIERAPSDEALAYIAAGPLEELLVYSGSVVIAPIEDEAARNERLRLALSGVWGIDRDNPVYDRWYAIMWKYGFAEGRRQPL